MNIRFEVIKFLIDTLNENYRKSGDLTDSFSSLVNNMQGLLLIHQINLEGVGLVYELYDIERPDRLAESAQEANEFIELLEKMQSMTDEEKAKAVNGCKNQRIKRILKKVE